MTTVSASIRPPFRFTRHAVDRFVRRVWPSLSGRAIADDREAISILCGAVPSAELMLRRSILGDAIWSVADPAMRWITKPAEYRGRRCAVVVTVLGGADDSVAEEEAEREVIEAARRLAAAPELGREEATTPAPGPAEGDTLKAYRAWLALETQRLAVERERLRAVIHAHAHAPRPRGPAPDVVQASAAAAKLEALRIVAEQQAAARVERTRRHMATQAHEALFVEILSRLAEVDPVGSADVIGRARERIAKWEAEGRLGAREETGGAS
jgi:hypothetical protein